jgi:hypothetical protein
MLALSSVSGWLGIMALFALAVAPAAFAVLPREEAGRVVGAIFPRYYGLGVALGTAGLAALLTGALGRSPRAADWAAAGLVALMLAVTLYAWLAVLPAAHAAREAMRQLGPTAAEALAFGRLHRLSTALNGVAMLAGAVAVAVLIGRGRA